MKLNKLILQESEMARKNNTNSEPFRWMAHHVAEIYIYLLPKININESSKITLEFGASTPNDVFFDAMLGCTNVFIEDFDFVEFYKSDTIKRDTMLVNEITKNLIRIYKRRNNREEDIQVILSTAEKVVATEFNLDIPIKRLQKKGKDKKIEVHRILNSKVGEAWKCIVIETESPFNIREVWMTNLPNFLDRTDYFNKLELKDDRCVIYNKLGNVSFQILFNE